MSSRSNTAAPPPPEEAALEARTLPSELVLEIVARTDAATLVRCAACCKPLRRDILSAAFIRRVCHDDPSGAGAGAVVAPRLFGFLPTYDMLRRARSRCSRLPPAFSLAHPATPAAARLAEKHLAPFFSRRLREGAYPLACYYDPLTSRNGLFVLRRRLVHARAPRESGVCVYDAMIGVRTFVPDPLEVGGEEEEEGSSMPRVGNMFVLLTASDGVDIGCSSLLLQADFTGLKYLACPIKLRTVSLDAGGSGDKEWSPVTTVAGDRSRCSNVHPSYSAVVLGGSIHWVMYGGSGRDYLHVLTYKLGAATAGRIELPVDRMQSSYRDNSDKVDVRLAATPDGRLTVIFREGLKISVWLMSAGADAGWAPHAVIDMEIQLLRLVVPEAPQSSLTDAQIIFHIMSERSGVLLFAVEARDLQALVVLDIETKEMHRVELADSKMHIQGVPFEVDLEGQLSAMKTF